MAPSDPWPDRATLEALLEATSERLVQSNGALAALGERARHIQLELADDLGVDSDTYRRVDELATIMGERVRESLRAGLLIGAAWARDGAPHPRGVDVRGNGTAGLLDRLIGVCDRYRLFEVVEQTIADTSRPGE